MKKKHIHILLSRFFGNDYPRDVRSRFGSWFIREEQREEKNEILEDLWNSLPVTPDIASFSELKRVNKRISHSKSHSLYRRLAAVAAIILLPLLGVVTTTLYYRQLDTTREVGMLECFVANGERKHITLPDGSAVWLNAGSILLYPEEFGETRTLYLSGEGNFTVAKSEDSPFIVKTNYVDVEALGTVFNLHSYPDEGRTTTTLETGKVRVDDKTGVSGSVVLSPNEQLVYNHADASFTKSIVNAARVGTWTDGFLVFQQESLGSIFRSLERRYNVKINYNDSKFSDITYTVRFHADETLDEALNVLKRIGVNFRYTIRGNDVYIQ